MRAVNRTSDLMELPYWSLTKTATYAYESAPGICSEAEGGEEAVSGLPE